MQCTCQLVVKTGTPLTGGSWWLSPGGSNFVCGKGVLHPSTPTGWLDKHLVYVNVHQSVQQKVKNQGLYKFNWTYFQEIPGGISRKIQDMFALLRPAMQCTEPTSLPKYITKTWYAQHRTVAKIKNGDQFLKWVIRYPVLSWLETNVVDHPHFIQKFPGGPYIFKEISRISRSCRHPENQSESLKISIKLRNSFIRQ